MNRLKSFLLYTVLTVVTVAMLFGVSAVERRMNALIRDHHLRFTGQIKNAPPMVAFTTIALGSFRGLIADLLWFRATGLQDKGSNYEMVQLASWITELQPTFSGATAFLAWNMAYNISVTCSDFGDRWRWVNEGIRLLRDKAIEYNPEDPALYKNLAFFFQHKLGNILDDANLYYKNQLAIQMGEVIGNRNDFDVWAKAPTTERTFLAAYGENPHYQAAMKAAAFADYEALYKYFRDHKGTLPEAFSNELTPQLLSEIDLALRSRWLTDKYKLDPARMAKLNEKYGQLEWRLPEAQAIYWAELGLEKMPSHADLNVERVITQSLYEAFRAGRLLQTSPDDYATITLAPNLNLVDAVKQTYIDAEKRNDGQHTFFSARINFMKEAIETLFCYGKFSKAEAYFEELKKIDEEPRKSRDVEEFVLGRFADKIKDANVKQTSGIIVGLIQRSLYYLAYGDQDAAIANERMARYIYRRYMNNVAKGSEVRMGLPPYRTLKRAAIEDSLKTFPPAMAAMLKQRIAEEKAAVEEEAAEAAAPTLPRP